MYGDENKIAVLNKDSKDGHREKDEQKDKDKGIGYWHILCWTL